MTTSKTPRTDEQELNNGGCYGYDFARELETELTEAQQTMREARELLEKVGTTETEYVDYYRRAQAWLERNKE